MVAVPHRRKTSPSGASGILSQDRQPTACARARRDADRGVRRADVQIGPTDGRDGRSEHGDAADGEAGDDDEDRAEGDGGHVGDGAAVWSAQNKRALARTSSGPSSWPTTAGSASDRARNASRGCPGYPTCPSSRRRRQLRSRSKRRIFRSAQSRQVDDGPTAPLVAVEKAPTAPLVAVLNASARQWSAGCHDALRPHPKSMLVSEIASMR